jgi:hypothetical protein
VVKVYSGVVGVSPPAAGEVEVLVKSGEQLKVPVQGAWPTPQPFAADMDLLPWSANHAKN